MEFFATAGNIPVHIQDSQKGGKTIILLHGYLETMYIYNELYDTLAPDYRVITMDLPGHGLSCSAPVNTMDIMATVVKGVLDVCGVKEATVAGHSLGGYVALACCSMFPEVFTKLVLLNSHPYPDPAEKSADRDREASLIEVGKLNSLAGISIPKMYYIENLRRCDDKIRETIELCETHDPSGIVACLRGMQQRPSTEAFLASVKIPVLGVMGDNDNFIPMEKINAMKESFPAVRFEIITNCGHNSFVEETARVRELLSDFV
ncbi:MAG: alpha/beta hydrolase [Bacteroidales bacterium]|nr:alpha/beta hydrolase [Bacteroidales bacterium]